MRVLFVASEAQPLIKTGGLADVIGSLPRALERERIDARVLLPAYPQVLERARSVRTCAHFDDVAGLGEAWLLAGRMPHGSARILLVRAPRLFERDGTPYEDERGRPWPDNVQRFALLSRVACAVATGRAGIRWVPHLVHAHDWQAGLVPALLVAHRGGRPPCVFTVHNVAYQGITPLDRFPLLRLPPWMLSMHALEFYGNLSLLKAGIVFGDRITTVSPTYAREIRTPRFGAGLEGVFEQRADDLRGILNGIDDETWNPATDPYLAERYDAEHPGGKRACREALEREMGFSVDPAAPILGIVSRLTHQKGLDLVLAIAPWLVERKMRLVVLGSGDADLAVRFEELARRHQRRIAFRLGYDEPLAHRIEAGADAFVMPSRYEPCGLNQLYSQRYGTPPIVHAVGGLADTVVDLTPETLADDSATGFLFHEPTATALAGAIERMAAAFADPPVWRRIVRAGMRRDFGWSRSARLYAELYRELCEPRLAVPTA